MEFLERDKMLEQSSEAEKKVPLEIWQTSSFQNWYARLQEAGNRLDDARPEWVLKVGPKKEFVLFWVLQVNIWVAAENRHKSNEVVLSRPDTSTVVLYYAGEAKTIREIHLVIIAEFRSSAMTSDGRVREAPGGSSFKPNISPLQNAQNEIFEEVGIRFAIERFNYVNVRQINAPGSTLRTHCFGLELSKQEFNQLCKISQQGEPLGNKQETEQIYLEIYQFGEIIHNPDVDYATLGIIYEVLSEVKLD